MDLFSLRRIGISLFIVQTITFIKLKNMNMVTIWLAVEKAIFSYFKCMRLKQIGFTDDKYI